MDQVFSTLRMTSDSVDFLQIDQLKIDQAIAVPPKTWYSIKKSKSNDELIKSRSKSYLYLICTRTFYESENLGDHLSVLLETIEPIRKKIIELRDTNLITTAITCFIDFENPNYQFSIPKDITSKILEITDFFTFDLYSHEDH